MACGVVAVPLTRVTVCGLLPSATGLLEQSAVGYRVKVTDPVGLSPPLIVTVSVKAMVVLSFGVAATTGTDSALSTTAVPATTAQPAWLEPVLLLSPVQVADQ